jgi:hypothetical protein
VLTDEKFFQGSLEYLRRFARRWLPLLRKDFIIDERQILESAENGADAILLIVRILTDEQLRHFTAWPSKRVWPRWWKCMTKGIGARLAGGLRRPAQCRRGGAIGRVGHARAVEARRRRGVPRGSAHAVAGRPKKVMEDTDNHLLVGKGAQSLRAQHGVQDRGRFDDREGPQTVAGMEAPDRSRTLPRPQVALGGSACESATRMALEGLLDRDHMSSAPSTATASTPRARSAASRPPAGWPLKFPAGWGTRRFSVRGSLCGRGQVGAAGSTGRGEANLFSLASFLIVESLRQGMAPKDAGMLALKRIAANTVEKRLRNSRGQPNFNVTFYILNAKGEHAGVALYGSTKFALWATRTGRKHWTS